MKRVVKRIINYVMYFYLVFHIEIMRYKSPNKKCIFFIWTPIHGNLGDQAIIYAQYRLFEEISDKEKIIEIPGFVYETFKEKLSNHIRQADLIIVEGGGNIGTLWIQVECVMRDIIKHFKNNQIIIFPQTAYFEQTEWGKAELEKSKKIYNAHPNLTIFCRDTQSYQLINSEFKGVKAVFTPDTVLFINNLNLQLKRNGILLCIRDDKEKIEENLDILKEIVSKSGYEVKNTSTVVDKRVYKWNRKKYLYNKWKEFSSAELVITDRLHGMIFAAITGTSCIALDNISHKVKQGYEWIKYLPYIRFCDGDIDGLEDEITKLMGDEEYVYDRRPLDKQFDLIKEEVRNAFN